MTSRTTIDVNGTFVPVSNLQKVFYPRNGFTKADVINYYIRVSPHLLPHLKDRPITLKRYPDGVEGLYFYEKNCPSHRPRWVKTVPVPRAEGGELNYCVMNSLPALVWAANLADLELHTFLHQAPAIGTPTAVVFDLDPGPPADILLCCEGALSLRARLKAMNLESFAKTSGSKGLQVYVPLNTRVTYEQTKAFARALAEALQRQFPDRIVAKMQKSLRPGKVLVDWSQNDDHKTTVAVYSLRARERPTVSTPVTWKEIETASTQRKASLLVFDSEAVLKRLDRLGDLFAPILTLKQKLPSFSSLSRSLEESPGRFRHSKARTDNASRSGNLSSDARKLGGIRTRPAP